ncbi:MAG TPA: hypothetical protein P5096_03510 [Patescibacteria group bacterium]|nr:hypothetical protein [Patescibacteria group bacterium]
MESALAEKEGKPIRKSHGNLESGFRLTWGQDSRFPFIVPVAVHKKSGEIFPLKLPTNILDAVREIRRLRGQENRPIGYNRTTQEFIIF